MVRDEILRYVQNDKLGLVAKFDGLTTHLILRCAQNDKGGLVLISSLIFVRWLLGFIGQGIRGFWVRAGGFAGSG